VRAEQLLTDTSGVTLFHPDLVASDLDGTLLPPDLVLTTATIAGVRRLCEAGVAFVICTGRMLQSARRMADRLALGDGLIVCYQGALVADLGTGEWLLHHPMSGDKAFWIEQGLQGASKNANLAMEGTEHLVVVGTPPTGGNNTQAGRQNLSSVGGQNGTTGINGAPVGNWQYEGTPGVADAYAPANATMSNGVPTMPAATNGGAPPQQPPQ